MASPVTAEKPSSITWSRTYGRIVGADSVQQTSDGGFVVAGVYDNLRVLKTNALGEPEWEKGYAPDGYYSYLSQVGSIAETRDHGYLVAGSATSSGYSTGVDGWLLKLDKEGNVQWSETYGGGADDGFFNAAQTSDGGYVVAGNTASVSSHYFNGWILRLGRFGNVLWQRAFVGEDVHSVEKTHDGGFVVVGTVGVDNKAEAWVFKLDREGNMVWQNAYEVAARTEAFSIHEIRNGGYIVAGHSSLGGLVLRLDREGNIVWQKSIPGSGFTTFSVLETLDRGFVVTGRFFPTSSDTGLKGPFLLKLDANGNLAWQRVYGGLNDFLYETQETRGGGLVAVGWTGDALVLKLDNNGSLGGCTLGSPSNASITQSNTIVTRSSIMGISPHLAATPEAVKITTVQVDLGVLCLAMVNRTNDEDSEHGPKRITRRGGLILERSRTYRA